MKFLKIIIILLIMYLVLNHDYLGASILLSMLKIIK